MKTTAKGTVLIVDGDAATRRVAEVGLRHAGYRVTVAGSPEQAIWFLEHTSPDAVLTAIQFEGEPLGWELVRLLRARPDGPRVAVIALRTESASREDESVELTDDLVPWPAGVRELELRLHQALVRRRVAEHLTGSGERRMKGDLSELSAIDLLTLVERSQTSGTLEIESSRGPATLWFADGRAIDGHFGRFTGEEAVFQVLIVDAGEFEWTIAPNKHADVIDQSMAETLAENLRRLDEWTRLCDELPDLDQALRVDPQRLQTTRVNLPAEQVALVERCNGRRSIRAVVEESEFDPLLALEVLRYLLDAKVLAPVSAGDVASGSLLVDVGELPPLPSFPEPFPGTSEDLGMDTPLVSGIPEDPGESNEYESFEGLDGLDALDRLDAPEPTGSSEAAADDQEASFLVRESTPKESSAAAYVFRPPRGQGAPSEPPPARRHQSVRIAAVDGRVEPPRGIKQAEAGGELELAPADPRSSRKIGRRRQSILVRRTRPLRLVDRGPAETVRSTRREVMSRSGLIAVGEILVEDPTLAPAAANVEAPSEASAAGPRAEGSVEIVSGAVTPAAGSIAASGIVSGTIITTGTAAISSERSGRWSEEGPEALLLEESLADLGRLSAMAAEFARVTGAPEGAVAAAPPTKASAEASAPSRPLLRPPEPVEEELIPYALRRRWWVLVLIAAAIVILLRIALRPTAEATPKTTSPSPSVGVAPTPTPTPSRPVVEASSKADASDRASAEEEASSGAAEPEAELADAGPPPRSAEEEAALAALFGRAESLYRRGQLTRAARLVNRILANEPRYAPALVLRANLDLEQGKLVRATTAARAAVEADPERAEAYLTVGVIAQERRAWAEALAAYERYLELAPDARYADSVRRQVTKLRRKVP